MKKKWIKRIVITVASLLLVFIIAAYFAMDYATNKILRAISVEGLNSTELEEGIPEETLAPNASSNPTVDPSPKVSIKPTNSSTPKPTPQYDPTISIDKAKDVKSSISFKDQSKISKILLSELNANDISLLTNLASGGLTVEKKKEAKKIILQKLSEDEYNELIQIAAKLGLSQGKNYQDSVKE